MSDYKFLEIEERWQSNWSKSNLAKCELDSKKPKFYN